MLVENLQVTGLMVVAQCSDNVTRQVVLTGAQARSVLHYCQHKLQGGTLQLTDFDNKNGAAIELPNAADGTGNQINRNLLVTAFQSMFQLIQQHHDASLPKLEAGLPCPACERSDAARKAKGMQDVFTLMALAMTELQIENAIEQKEPTT